MDITVMDGQDLRKIILDVLPKKRRVLVFINPFGGAGAAATNWLVARPLFEFADSRLEYTVIETERRNHAYDYV